jgi:hypothetical protein
MMASRLGKMPTTSVRRPPASTKSGSCVDDRSRRLHEAATGQKRVDGVCRRRRDRHLMHDAVLANDPSRPVAAGRAQVADREPQGLADAEPGVQEGVRSAFA